MEVGEKRKWVWKVWRSVWWMVWPFIGKGKKGGHISNGRWRKRKRRRRRRRKVRGYVLGMMLVTEKRLVGMFGDAPARPASGSGGPLRLIPCGSR